ncbi:MAG: hypothetical protein ACI4AN_03425 [Muribaculaceae bacterium]
MDKSSTLEDVYESKSVIVSSVRQSTINFLKQFARAYSYEKKLKPGIGNFVVN